MPNKHALRPKKMAEENFDYNPLENSEDFTTNGGDSSFAQVPQETLQFPPAGETGMSAPGTEDDLNGGGEFHQAPPAQKVPAVPAEPVSDAGPPPGTEESTAPPPSSDQDGPRPHRPEETDKKLFVGGLTWNTTAAQIREHFQQYGDIENVDLKMDMDGHSRGFAFVQFEDPSMIEKVISIGEHRINGKLVDPKPANPRGRRRMPPEEEPMKKVFVGGITPELDDDTIRTHFTQYGEVDQVDRPRTVGPQKKRYLFVTFLDEDAAKRSIAEPKQNIGGVMCDVNKATPKQDFGGRGQYGDRGWDQGYGYPPRGRGGPPPRGRGRGGYPPPGYDPYGGYPGYDPYAYDPNYGYPGYDPNYYGGYDYSGYPGYDPNYYGGYGYDWSGYYGSGYDYSSYYGAGQAPPEDPDNPGGDQTASYDGGKAKRGAAAAGSYHPYRKQ